MKNYIVTLKDRKSLDKFYQEMENNSSVEFIPDRSVQCVKRRINSRNTVYLLTDEEAEKLKKDDRVIDVDLSPLEKGLKIKKLFTQTSNSWDKSWAKDPSDDNWGLLRCVNGENLPDWGTGTVDPNDAIQSGSITLTSTGKNVDVVIVDEHVDPNHPEMATNSDGSGGTRVNQLNWYQYANLDGELAEDVGETYTYSALGDHGMHVAGTVAGNTQGWARDAVIYSMSPFGDDVNLQSEEIFEYIRLFHLNKTINPQTGKRNPTVVNNSWGYVIYDDISTIMQVFFRGQLINGPFTNVQLEGYGINIDAQDTSKFEISSNYSAVDADIQDAIDEGVIMIAAAGNNNMKISVSGDQDYDNYLVYNFEGTNYGIYYNRENTPGSTDRIICVGATSNSFEEHKADYSNCGPRVDIYAPGTAIQSSLYSDIIYGSSDPRGGGRIGKYQGTSMASPQVTGVVACLLEQMPNLKQEDVKNMLLQYSGKNQLSDSNTDDNDQDILSLQGSPNNHLTYIRLRQVDGATYPRENINVRPNSGATFPRRNVRNK